MALYPFPIYPVLIYPIPIHLIPFYPITKEIETYPILLKNAKQNISKQVKELLILTNEQLPYINKTSKQNVIGLCKMEMNSKHERTEALFQFCDRNVLRLYLKRAKVINCIVDLACWILHVL